MSARSLSTQIGSALLALLTVANARPAFAQNAPQFDVELYIRSCPAELESEIRRLIGIELGEPLLAAGREPVRSANADQLDSLFVTCDGDVSRIEAKPRGQSKRIATELNVNDFPRDAAPRAIALAAIEALAAWSPAFSEQLQAVRSRRSVPRAPTQSAQPVTMQQSPAATLPRSSAAANQRSLWLGIGPEGQLFSNAPALLALGARLDVAVRFSAPLDAGLALDVAWTRREVELGELDAKLFSAASWASLRLGHERWSASLGAGARVGIAALRGAPASSAAVGHQTIQPWGGPLLIAHLARHWNAFGAAVVFEGGAVALGTEGLAGGSPALVLRGAWLSAALTANIGL